MTAPQQLCLFGNSHIAALKEAHRSDPARWAGFEITFVGAHEDLILQTEITGDRLVPTTDVCRDAFTRLNGRAEIDLSRFDAFAVAGALPVEAIVQLYREIRTTGFASVADSDDLASESFALISDALAQDIAAGALIRRTGPKFAARLRDYARIPMLLLAPPMPSSRLLDEPVPTTSKLRSALRAGDAGPLAALHRAACDRVCADLDAGFVPQPPQTLYSPILTDALWMHDGPRLSAALETKEASLDRQPPTDLRHAGTAYGGLMLDMIAAKLQR